MTILDYMFRPANAVSSFREIREVYVDRIIVAVSIFGIPLVMVALVRALTNGLYVIAAVQIVSLTVGIFVTFNIQRIPLKYKFMFSCVVFYLIGLASVYSYGLGTSGWAFLTAGSVVSATILGIRRAIVIMLAITSCAVLIGISHVYFPHIKIELLQAVYSGAAWTIVLCSFVVISISLTIASGTMYEVTKVLLRKLELQNKEIMELANSDALTKLANRRAAYNHIQYLIAQHGHNAIYLVLIDLDGFKYINDTYGHDAGDTALCVAGTRLKSSVREHDMVARLGGDEFLIVVSSPHNDVEALANRMLTQIKIPFEHQGKLLNVGASIGVVEYNFDYVTTPDELVKLADGAMFKVKRDGKDAVHYHAP